MSDATTTGLVASSYSTTFGQTITLTATVSAATSATGVPSGTVEFYDGTMDLGPGVLAVTGGYDVATMVTPPLALGDHGFSAVYNGDGTFNQSNSSVEIVSVTPALGSLALTGSGTAVAGATYSLTLPTTDSGSHTITQWVVNWGDGSSDTLTSPDSMSSDTHVYQSPGDYLIQAIATAADGNSSATLDNDVAPASEWSILSPLPPGEGQGEGGAVTSVAVQPDGSIVTVDSGSADGPLVRFTSSGQPDGTAFDDVSASIATITSVAVQPVPGGFDILAAGSGYSVARFNSDGSLDTTFGNGGIATPSSALATGTAGAGGVGENPQMFVEPDGNIVLAGLEPDTGGGGADDLVLAEFQANGQPDDSFGTDDTGIETYDLGAAASSCDAAYQPGGKIVAVVGLSAGSGSTEVLAFTSTGSLVSGFTGSGSFTTTAIKSDPLVAIQPNGSIDVAGGNGTDFAIVQYTASGGTGWTHSSAGTGSVGALAVQPGGRIVAAVDDVIGSTNSWRLYGFTASGSADSTFDGLGAISALTGSAAALAMEPNGDILLAGKGASDAFFAQYSAGGPVVAVTELDVAPTYLSVTASPATYSGADTEIGGSASPAQIEGSFTDPGSVQEAHNVTIVWGDGSPNTTFTLPAGQTTFDYPLPQYAVSNEYTVKVTVADADGSNATSAVSVEVNYANTQPSGLTLSLDQSSVSLGDAVNLSGSFTDPQSNIAHLVTINWGDSTDPPDITTISLGAGETTFQANPQTYANTGAYTISVTISGLDGTTGTVTTPVTVNAVPDEVMIASSVPVAWENGGQNGSFVVTRVGSTSSKLIVDYTVKGTAVAGTDFDGLSGYVTIPAGQASAAIPVIPISDGVVNDQTVIIGLTASSSYTLATGFTSSTVAISDNVTNDGAGGSLGSAVVSMTYFADDGTAEPANNTALVGDEVPFGICVSGDTYGYTFTLYTSGSIVVSTEPDGSGVINSGTVITLTSAYLNLWLSSEDPTSTAPVSGTVSVGGYYPYDDGASGYGTYCSLPADLGVLHMNMTGVVPKNHIDVNGNKAPVMVGQEIDVEVVRTAANGSETGVYNGVTWSLPGSIPVMRGPTGSTSSTAGDYVKDFDPSKNADNQVTNFGYFTQGGPPPQTYAQSTFGFYWVDAGGSKVTAAVFDPQNRTGNGTVTGLFTVQRPNVDVTALPLGRLTLSEPTNDSVALAYALPKTFGPLLLGSNANNGMTWRINNYPVGWKYGFAQVVWSEVTTYVPPPNSVPDFLGFQVSGVVGQLSPHDGLDTSFPFAYTWFSGMTPAPLTFGDSPYVRIYRGGNAELSDYFTVWYGCEPNLQGSIWVPLARVNWSLVIRGTWYGNQPSVSLVASPAKSTLFLPATDFPEWNEVVWATHIGNIRY